jgi:hypothetical protein
MMVKMVIGKSLVNVVSAYAPQAALSEDEKDTFWDGLQDVVARVPPREFIMLGGDLNGHVGSGSDGYEGLHGGFGFGKRNKEGDRILEFCEAMDLLLDQITYESGIDKSVIDYLVVRRGDRNLLKNVRGIWEKHGVSQHCLLIGDFALRGREKCKKKICPEAKDVEAER